VHASFVFLLVCLSCLLLQFDEDADVAAVWREVWEESTASAGAGLRLHMTEVVKVSRDGCGQEALSSAGIFQPWCLLHPQSCLEWAIHFGLSLIPSPSPIHAACGFWPAIRAVEQQEGGSGGSNSNVQGGR
jgi:hypothetical protein